MFLYHHELYLAAPTQALMTSIAQDEFPIQAPKYQTSTPRTLNFSPSSLNSSFANVGHALLIPLANESSSQSPYLPSPPPTERKPCWQRIVKSFSPVYGKALKRIPRLGEGFLDRLDVPFVEGGFSEAKEAEDEFLEKARPLIVVLRVMCVVSAEGGGGSEERSGKAGRGVARQRKHSPVP